MNLRQHKRRRVRSAKHREWIAIKHPIFGRTRFKSAVMPRPMFDAAVRQLRWYAALDHDVSQATERMRAMQRLLDAHQPT